jgi:hypothetical protein
MNGLKFLQAWVWDTLMDGWIDGWMDQNFFRHRSGTHYWMDGSMNGLIKISSSRGIWTHEWMHWFIKISSDRVWDTLMD